MKIKNLQLGSFYYTFGESRLVFEVKAVETKESEQENSQDKVQTLKGALFSKGDKEAPPASEISKEKEKKTKREAGEIVTKSLRDLKESGNTYRKDNEFLKEPLEGMAEIPPEKMQKAIQEGQGELLTYLTERTKKLPKRFDMVMAPLDETRFFRLGEDGLSVGYGLSAGRLAKIGKKLLTQGFPQINRAELDLILFSRLASFKKARPEIRITGQHFPREDTGASTLEATEKGPVHIGKDFDVKIFQEAINTGLIDDVMIGHASYEYDEKYFPGIDELRKNLDLHPLLRDVDPNRIPASFNPLMVRYLRDVMGHKGLIIPDWYDMGAIRKFLQPKENDSKAEHITSSDFWEIFGWDSVQAQALQVQALVLAVDAGINFVTGVEPSIAFHDGWKNFKKKFPEEYSRFEEKLGKVVKKTFEIIKPKDSDVQIDINKLTFEEKILFLTYNRMHLNEWKDFYERHMADLTIKNKEAFKILIERGTGNYDVWNRTGVMTLILRQKIIEHLTGEKFGNLPQKISEEKTWFSALMKNQKFQIYYDKIDWDSPAMQRWFTEMKKKISQPPVILATAK